MFRSLFEKKKKKETKQHSNCSIPDFIQTMRKSTDFMSFPITEDERLCLFYFKSLTEEITMKHFLLSPMKEELSNVETIEDLHDIVPIESIMLSPSLNDIRDKLLSGFVLVQLKYGEDSASYALIRSESTLPGRRAYNDTENEYSVVGPKTGFVESLDVNFHLLRQNIITERLIFKEIIVGSLSKTKVVVAYLEDVTNEQHINTVTERLGNLDIDVPFDTTMLEQLVSDNSNSPFPLLLSTERLDRATYTLLSGQVLILMDGSPYVLAGPTTLFDFFVSPEDFYLPWMIGSFFRIIRMFGALLSIFSSPIYIAVLTYHYQMIPKDLMGPIIFSRANVPFPPVLEVLFLEITIELLREAGTRLPTKVGQTLGIVGGIVIGQASVEAALTSTILLIAVALSALASFTTPTIKMTYTIRILRFPLIILAGMLGGLGLIIGFVIILAHLIRLKSLGSPYLVPIYPFRDSKASSTFIRYPFSMAAGRARYLRPKLPWRYSPSKAKIKHDGEEE